jgi:phage protein D
MPVGTDLYRLRQLESGGISPGAVMAVEVHPKVQFTTTGTQAEFTTNLTKINGAILTVKGTTAPVTEKDAGRAAVSLSSGTVTLTRDAGGTSNLAYSVILFGDTYDTN